MQGNRRTGAILAIAAILLVPVGVRAQSTPTGWNPSSASRAQELAGVDAHRSQVIREVIDRWRSEFRPFDPSQNTGGEEEQLTAALQSASAEKLLAASQAQTYEEVLAALNGRWLGPSVIPLAPGQIQNALGDTGADLVFTPITPCRIIDTRSATDPLLLGPIGPNLGKQFSVSLTNYATQGGSAVSCGIPLAPAAVAINVTSVNQTGSGGNLRVIQTGGGVPNASLLNYTAGVIVANAAVVRSAGSPGGSNIYIYSGGFASDVVVDIMGYFAAPVATALDCVNTAVATTTVAAGATFSAIPPACAAGYTQVSVGCRSVNYNTANWAITGYYTTNLASCWGTNISAGSATFEAVGRCCRVPGR